MRVRRAIAAVAAGRPVVVADDTAPDNAGYLVFAADAATTKLLAFTIRHTSGYVRVALPRAECERLNLPPMCHGDSGHSNAAAQRVSVDRCGTGTGISAADRARTIAALAAPRSVPSDFQRPGHVIPLEVAEAGVLGRSGPAEAAVDLARLAGRGYAGVLCDIVSRENPAAMAGAAELAAFADDYGLAFVSITDLVAYRRRTEPQVVRVAETVLTTRAGVSRIVGFRGVHDGTQHLAVIIGAAGADQPLVLHVHVECLTGDVFSSTACRCGGELESALAMMAARGSGVVVYLRPPGPLRACGLSRRSEVPEPDLVPDTITWILRDLGVTSIRLSDDTPDVGLVLFGAILDHGPVVAR